MRISLWQQFSSNHSAFYYIIGTFKTPDDAQAAYEEIRKILQEIDDWHRENPMGIEKDWNNGGPLPPEAAIAERLGIEWPEMIDWTGWADYANPNFIKFNIDPAEAAQQLIEEAITVLANTVIAQNPDQTHMGGITFKNLLEHFGGEISGEGFDPGGKVVGRDGVDEFQRLHFIAPNEEIANQTEKAIRNYLGGDRNSDTNLPPWFAHQANFEKILRDSQYLNARQVELLQKEAEGHIEMWTHLHELSRTLVENHALSGTRAELRREGLEFRFEKIVFADGNFGLAALIAYLEVSGFTDIRISYGYVPREPEDY